MLAIFCLQDRVCKDWKGGNVRRAPLDRGDQRLRAQIRGSGCQDLCRPVASKLDPTPEKGSSWSQLKFLNRIHDCQPLENRAVSMMVSIRIGGGNLPDWIDAPIKYDVSDEH